VQQTWAGIRRGGGAAPRGQEAGEISLFSVFLPWPVKCGDDAGGAEGHVIFGGEVGRTTQYGSFDIGEWTVRILFSCLSLCLYK
jgi:hypothetical protein